MRQYVQASSPATYCIRARPLTAHDACRCHQHHGLKVVRAEPRNKAAASQAPEVPQQRIPADPLPNAPSLNGKDSSGGDGGGDGGGDDESGDERTWRETADDVITVAAAVFISLGIRTCALSLAHRLPNKWPSCGSLIHRQGVVTQHQVSRSALFNAADTQNPSTHKHA